MEVSTGFQAMSTLMWPKICLDLIAMAKNQNICFMNYLIKVPQMAVLYHIYVKNCDFYFLFCDVNTVFTTGSFVSSSCPILTIGGSRGRGHGPLSRSNFLKFVHFPGGGHTNRLEPQPSGVAGPSLRNSWSTTAHV